MIGKYAPPLAKTHPGFFRVSNSLFLLHVFMCIDALIVRPILPFFLTLGMVLPLTFVGVAHLACCVLFLFGLYGDFKWARLSFWVSLSVFAVTALVAVWGFVTVGTASLTLIGLLLHALLTDAAAAIEPEVPR